MGTTGLSIGEIHAQSMQWRAARAGVLAHNIANADTPGYRARDLNFQSLLQSIENPTPSGLSQTQSGHVSPAGITETPEAWVYRNPLHPALDGNTVDTQLEYSAFSENAVRYMASFSMLNHHFRNLLSVIQSP